MSKKLLSELFDSIDTTREDIIELQAAVMERQAVVKPKLFVMESSLWDKEDIVLEVIKLSGEHFQNASSRLKNDKNFIMTAIRSSSYSACMFKHIAQELKGDINIVENVLESEQPLLIKHADSLLLQNKNFILKAVGKNPYVLTIPDIVIDKEIVLTAIKGIDPTTYDYYIENLEEGITEFKAFTDSENYEMVTKCHDRGYINKEDGCICLLKYADKFRGDREVVMAEVAKSGIGLCYASDELKGDMEVVEKAMDRYIYSFVFASDTLKKNKPFILASLQKNGLLLKYVLNDMKEDKEVVLSAVRQNGKALVFALPALKNNKEVVLSAVSNNGLSILHASDNQRRDKEVSLMAVSNTSDAVLFIDPGMKSDPDIMFEVVRKKGRHLVYASEELRTMSVHRGIRLAAVHNDVSALKYLKLDDYVKDYDFLFSIITKNKKFVIDIKNKVNINEFLQFIQDKKKEYVAYEAFSTGVIQSLLSTKKSELEKEGVHVGVGTHISQNKLRLLTFHGLYFRQKFLGVVGSYLGIQKGSEYYNLLDVENILTDILEEKAKPKDEESSEPKDNESLRLLLRSISDDWTRHIPKSVQAVVRDYQEHGNEQVCPGWTRQPAQNDLTHAFGELVRRQPNTTNVAVIRAIASTVLTRTASTDDTDESMYELKYRKYKQKYLNK